MPKEPERMLNFFFQTDEPTELAVKDDSVSQVDVTSVSDAIAGNVSMGMIDEEEDEEDATDAEQRRPMTESKPLLN